MERSCSQSWSKGIHLVAEGLSNKQAQEFGFDAASYSRHRIVERFIPKIKLLRKFRYIYRYAMKFFLLPGKSTINEYPSIVPNWDSTPRFNWKGVVLYNSTPQLFRCHVNEAIQKVIHKPFEKRIIFIKSWNEWAEGNYLEPDLKFGRSYLEVLRNENLDN